MPTRLKNICVTSLVLKFGCVHILHGAKRENARIDTLGRLGSCFAAAVALCHGLATLIALYISVRTYIIVDFTGNLVNGLRHAIVNGVPGLNGTDLPSVGSDMPPKELHAHLRLVSTFSIISNELLGVRNRMSIAEMEQSNDADFLDGVLVALIPSMLMLAWLVWRMPSDEHLLTGLICRLDHVVDKFKEPIPQEAHPNYSDA